MRNNVIDFQPKETKKINKKKLAITISIIVLLLTISILAIIYCLNKNFRNVMDVYLFRKNISGENVLILIEEKFAKELEELSFVTYCDMYRFMHSGQAVAFNFSNSSSICSFIPTWEKTCKNVSFVISIFNPFSLFYLFLL